MEKILKKYLPDTSLRPKLLLVDDQLVNVHILYELFRGECETFMASHGQQAIDMCQSILPDLVLLDVAMPVVDGYEVCRQLKADPLTKDIPIIFVTSNFDEADEVKGFELGAVDYIRKPINPVITRARVFTQVALKYQTDLLHSMAKMDGLTGVANRRKFDEQFHLHWLQCAREKQSLSLIMLDVDYFKKYNDFYGHQAGDLCLTRIAQTINKSLQRPYDMVARYGGEEFVCLLPNTDLDGATHVAQLFQTSVNELAIEHLQSKVAPIVTVSLGVASIIPSTIQRDPLILIEATDKQLYCAKESGRNCLRAVMVS